MRRLVYVPIVHAEPDLGSLADRIRDAYVARFGKRKWERHKRAVEDMWRGIAERIFSLGLDYHRVKIYQDGLPVCGAEEVIVRDLARCGSPNHRIVARLMDLGATLVGTENPRLLVREYQEIKRQIEGPQGDRERGDGGSILEERDRFVAQRIRMTLRDGETGILLMGRAHQVHRLLPLDVRIDIVTP